MKYSFCMSGCHLASVILCCMDMDRSIGHLGMCHCKTLMLCCNCMNGSWFYSLHCESVMLLRVLVRCRHIFIPFHLCLVIQLYKTSLWKKMFASVKFLRLDFEVHAAVGNQTSLLTLATFYVHSRLGKVCIRLYSDKCYTYINICFNIVLKELLFFREKLFKVQSDVRVEHPLVKFKKKNHPLVTKKKKQKQKLRI